MHYELLIFFFIIAFTYASVGFGGGSSYLALLSVYAMPFQEMKLTALVCNIIVVTGGTIIFVRRKELPLRKILPLVLASVPMAYIGARLKVGEHTFFVVLGVCLIIAGALLWIRPLQSLPEVTTEKGEAAKEVVTGGSIGFLSGMVGIGGGIFLAPVLNLMRWDSPKKIAATAGFFILINSIAGIAGQLSSLPASVNYTQIGLLAIAVLAGGQLGARTGAAKFSQLAVRRVTAVLVTAAGIEVLLKHLY
jgi:uncharacterized protein